MDCRLLFSTDRSHDLCNLTSHGSDSFPRLQHHLQFPRPTRISQRVLPVCTTADDDLSMNCSSDMESLKQSILVVKRRPILRSSPYCRLVRSKRSRRTRHCKLCSRKGLCEEEGVTTEVGYHDHTGEADQARASQSNSESRQGLATTLALFLLEFYKREISPFLPRSCRYVPTCSEYATQAYKKYGVLKGTILTAWRLARCNPFGGSGFDPPRWFGESRPPFQ